ncbi:hypothetical protein IQ35_00369 [Sphingobium wenxiniae]|uniref:Uncharacterized protein n=1 Tax=Sphingobium wenxiniae (strain DSM 21828 / CGMCC 1.7748 / JZ-1) TaxID=595605 RepID=A0A562KQR3_SPHWJ|nr:hypothetical protein IQ35_00369 [Sphingobium wenxiniae]
MLNPGWPALLRQPDRPRNGALAVLAATSAGPGIAPSARERPAIVDRMAVHGLRTPAPRAGNKPPPHRDRGNATRSSRADRCRRSSLSGDRRSGASAARNAPAIARAGLDRPDGRRAAMARSRHGRRMEARFRRGGEPDCRWRSTRNRSSGPRRHAALPLIGIRRTSSFAASVFGRVTVSTPFLKLALAWSRSTPLGRPMRRSKRP